MGHGILKFRINVTRYEKTDHFDKFTKFAFFLSSVTACNCLNTFCLKINLILI